MAHNVSSCPFVQVPFWQPLDLKGHCANGSMGCDHEYDSQPSFGNKFAVDELSWQLPPGGQLIQSHDILSLMLVVSRYSSYRLQSRATFHAGLSQADLFSFGILPLNESHGVH